MASLDQGYTPIPDVEQGVVKDTSNVEVIPPTEKYPQANEQELAFLVALDDAIENADPEVRLPTLKAKDLGPPDSPKEFLETLKIPTIAFGVSAFSALITMATHNPIFYALFPYYSCILMFIASIPPMKERVIQRFNLITAKIQRQIETVTNIIEGISQASLGYVDKAESLMDKALAPMKEKLDTLTKLEKYLQKVNPNIDVPDPQDIEEAFDGYSDKIEAIFAVVNEALDLARSIPTPLQSEEKFDQYVCFPVLAVILVLQLLAVWGSTHSKGADVVSANITETSGNDWSEVSNQANLLSISFQTYISTIIQLVLLYVSTQVSALILAFNQLVKRFEGDANSNIDKYVKEPFREVFEVGFTKVKETVLKLINKMEKLEEPLRKCQELADAEALLEKAKAEAAAKAKALEKAKAEAAAKAKAEAERKAKEAKELAERKAREAKELAERKLREAQEKAKAEAERKAKEAKELAERKAQEAKEEAERKMKEAQEKAKAEAEKKAKEAKEAAERKAQEAKEAAERKAQEAKEAAERMAQEAKEEAERQAREAKEKAEKAKEAAEKLAKLGGGGFGGGGFGF